MSRKVVFDVYKFNELSKDVQRKVLEDFCGLLVENNNWYYDIYDCAKRVGFEIKGFDFDEWYIAIKLNIDAMESIETVLKQLSCRSPLYFVAKYYYDVINRLIESGKGTPVMLDKQYNNYFEDMKRTFLQMLYSRYEYLTDDETLANFFVENDYEFFEDGKLFIV